VRRSGGFETIASYTRAERDALIALARSFDQMPRPEVRVPRSTPSAVTGDRPGDDYNRRTTWSQLLEPAGWTHVGDRGDVLYWRRPGKTHGISASSNIGGSDLFYPFTSSTEFEPEKSHSKFAAYATLEHHGDFKKAALALSRLGYGQRDTQRPTAEPAYTRPAADTGRGQCVLAPLSLRPYSGWFQRGATHLIAGSSGAGKTTLVLDLLQAQALGALFLGHVGARLEFLVLFADRGAVSNAQTAGKRYRTINQYAGFRSESRTRKSAARY
jgi:AAA domain